MSGAAGVEMGFLWLKYQRMFSRCFFLRGRWIFRSPESTWIYHMIYKIYYKIEYLFLNICIYTCIHHAYIWCRQQHTVGFRPTAMCCRCRGWHPAAPPKGGVRQCVAGGACRSLWFYPEKVAIGIDEDIEYHWGFLIQKLHPCLGKPRNPWGIICENEWN